MSLLARYDTGLQIALNVGALLLTFVAVIDLFRFTRADPPGERRQRRAVWSVLMLGVGVIIGGIVTPIFTLAYVFIVRIGMGLHRSEPAKS